MDVWGGGGEGGERCIIKEYSVLICLWRKGEGREGGGEGEAIDVFLKSTMCSFACGGREGREGGREGGREVTTACKMRERARGRE